MHGDLGYFTAKYHRFRKPMEIYYLHPKECPKSNVTVLAGTSHWDLGRCKIFFVDSEVSLQRMCHISQVRCLKSSLHANFHQNKETAGYFGGLQRPQLLRFPLWWGNREPYGDPNLERGHWPPSLNTKLRTSTVLPYALIFRLLLSTVSLYVWNLVISYYSRIT